MRMPHKNSRAHIINSTHNALSLYRYQSKSITSQLATALVRLIYVNAPSGKRVSAARLQQLEVAARKYLESSKAVTWLAAKASDNQKKANHTRNPIANPSRNPTLTLTLPQAQPLTLTLNPFHRRNNNQRKKIATGRRQMVRRTCKPLRVKLK